MMMHGWRQSPSTSTIISWYASLTTMVMIARTAVHDLVPLSVQRYVEALVHHYIFRPRPKGFTLIFDATTGYTRNEIFDAVEAYLSTKPDNKTDCLNVTKSSTNKNLLFSFNTNEVIQEEFQGVQLTWRFYRGSSESESPAKSSSFHLSFPKEHKDLIIGSYIPFVLEKHKMMTQEERVLKIHTLDTKHNYHHVGPWNSVNLDHPATFDTLAMEPSEKEAIIQDLDRFRSRKGFYRRVGRAWKRGYLLYGPPGTGKSSLIGAMANYLKFDVYDLQLASVHDDCDLRRVLLATGNRSILVIEDIDCGAELPDRNKKTAAVRSGKSAAVQGSAVYSHDGFTYRPTITLSGLLNFIDGLWSSCGDERIIVFTTNHKEKLEPALLRPGRMDMHIHMSYCTDQGFKVLANNYLGESAATHTLSPQIAALIRDANATPAQLAEELMKSDDPDVALAKVLNLLHRKIAEAAATAQAQVDKDKDLMEVGDDNNNAEQLVENKQQTNGWK